MFHGLHDLSIQQSTTLTIFHPFFFLFLILLAFEANQEFVGSQTDFRSGVLQPAEDMLQRAKNK